MLTSSMTYIVLWRLSYIPLCACVHDKHGCTHQTQTPNIGQCGQHWQRTITDSQPGYEETVKGN